MPLRGQHTWSEDDDGVELEIPLKGTPSSKVDIYVADLMVKVNFAPYLILLDLPEPVDDAATEAAFEEGVLRVRLRKVERGRWGRVHADDLSKQERMDRRAATMQRKEARNAEKQNARRAGRREASDLALRKQMAMEDAERETLEARKAEEKAAAEAEVYETLARVTGDSTRKKPSSEAQTRDSSATQSSAGSNHRRIFDDADEESSDEEEHRRATETKEDANNFPAAVAAPSPKEDPEEEEIAYIPAPRNHAKATISFTGRVFPTPLRQSRVAEEEDWLARNKHLLDARRRAEAAARGEGPDPLRDARDISERDPTWLKERGDSLFQAGDTGGAFNAYTAALLQDPVHLRCLANRAACGLRSGHVDAVIRDCTTCLGLLPTPPRDSAPPLPLGSSSASAATASRAGEGGSFATPEVRAEQAAERAALETAEAVARLFDGEQVERPGPLLSSQSPEGERSLLVKVLVRRATAFAQRGEFARAAADFRAAISVAQTHPKLQAQVEELRGDAARMDHLHACDLTKKEGDQKFREKSFAEARTLYEEALAREPLFVPALVNLAAVHTALRAHQECARACTQALDVLGVEGEPDTTAMATILERPAKCDFLPGCGSSRLRQWVLSALIRRAAAYCQLHDFSPALRDYRRALELDPLNQKLQADMKRITSRMVVREETVSVPPDEAAHQEQLAGSHNV